MDFWEAIILLKSGKKIKPTHSDTESFTIEDRELYMHFKVNGSPVKSSMSFIPTDFMYFNWEEVKELPAIGEHLDD